MTRTTASYALLAAVHAAALAEAPSGAVPADRRITDRAVARTTSYPPAGVTWKSTNREPQLRAGAVGKETVRFEYRLFVGVPQSSPAAGSLAAIVTRQALHAPSRAAFEPCGAD